MQNRTQIGLAFGAGAVLATLCTAFPLLRWHNQQSQLFWTKSVDDQLRTMSQLQRGQPAEALRRLEQRLPGMVISVHSFGRNAQTDPMLRSAKEFYRETGKPIPPEIASILSAF
ncbi:MAG: hypothetical protein KF791_13075 [Verrucomicrobiae bacterium]|nr:hypothetical protein [Verrucomicrobiae bacterium]